jgi:D-glycero-D-manno-heptose 1,7-bisphosphate phosphatase
VPTPTAREAGLRLRDVRHLIVDRDGVLNAEPAGGEFVREPAQFHWLPGSLEALARLSAAGIRISVASNQSGVGRGLMSPADLARVHARMTDSAAAAGGSIDAIFCCPHAPDAGCECRKPAPGLVLAAMRASGIAPAATLVVGDDARDVAAARAAGVAAALVRSGKGRAVEQALADPTLPVFEDLGQLVEQLLLASTPARQAAER